MHSLAQQTGIINKSTHAAGEAQGEINATSPQNQRVKVESMGATGNLRMRYLQQVRSLSRYQMIQGSINGCPREHKWVHATSHPACAHKKEVMIESIGALEVPNRIHAPSPQN